MANSGLVFMISQQSETLKGGRGPPAIVASRPLVSNLQSARCSASREFSLQGGQNDECIPQYFGGSFSRRQGQVPYLHPQATMITCSRVRAQPVARATSASGERSLGNQTPLTSPERSRSFRDFIFSSS